jgi:hypothetical protein
MTLTTVALVSRAGIHRLSAGLAAAGIVMCNGARHANGRLNCPEEVSFLMFAKVHHPCFFAYSFLT